MAGPNIPGLNENVMRSVMKAKMRPSQTQRPEVGMAEDEYKRYRKTASPAMQKMMWPSIAATTLTDPMYASPILKGMGMNIPEEVMRSSLGMVGAAGYLGPKVLSEGLKSRRLGYERQFAPQLGAVGKASRALDSLSTIRYLMTLPGYTQQLLGGGQGILKHTPRFEHFLTGTAGNVIKGKGSTAVEGGGFLTHGYEALKGAGDFITGGHVSGAIASGAKKGGLAGMASSGVGMLDKGISGLLSSPMGVALGITGAQVGLAIYKSIKLARLTPTRQSPDTLGRKYFGRDAASPAMQKILTLASTGKIDPQTLSFMVLQVIEGDIRKTNMMLAGVRGELAAESDFIQQKQDKGEKGFTSNYGRDVLGEDDRGVILRGLDALERTLSTVKTKFDPFTQLTNFAFGLLRGKMILPKHEASRIAQIYGYDDEQKMMKEKAESFGVAIDQTRLIHTPSKAIAEMASTFETKQMALASATLDVNRYMLAELMTIRMSAFGIEQNILYRKEPGMFKQFMSDMFDKLNPLNLPGINAVYNVAKGLGKFAFKTLPSIPNQMFEMGKKALTGGRDKLFGEEYAKIKDRDEWLKEAGLFSPVAERAQVYIADGLPEQIERIRSVLYNTYYIQEDILDVFGGQQKRIDRLGVWSSTEKRYLTAESAKKIEESQKIALESAAEKAFRSGPLGKLMYFVDILNTKVGAGFGKRLEQKETVARSIRRLGATEDVTGKIERAIGGGQETFVSKRALNEVLAGLSSIKTREAITPISMAEIESELRLERVPTSAKWMSGATAVGAAMGVLPILLGFTTGGLGALGVGAVYAELRRRREKEILTAREAEIQTVSETERQIKTMEDYFQIPQEARMAERGVGGVIPTGPHAPKTPKKKKLLPLDRLQISGPADEFKAASPQENLVTKFDDMNNRLSTIASYLGFDSTRNLYNMFTQDKPTKHAKVEIIDGLPNDPYSLMTTLRNIKDFLGDKAGSVYELLAPGPRYAEVKLLEMKERAKGGPVDKNKPVLVGEEGKPEIFMPALPGVIIPNDKIDKFAEGGMVGGDKFNVFNQIYQKLQDIFVVNQEALAIDIYQEKKAEKDAQQQTMQEKLAGLKVRQEAKAESIWKKDVVDLLSGILKKPLTFTKEKVKAAGFSLWDFLKGLDWGNILEKLLLGLGLAGLGAAIWELVDNIKPILTKLSDLSNWLKQNGMNIVDQLKVLGRGMLGAGLLAGSAATGGFAAGKALKDAAAAKAAGKAASAEAKIAELAKMKEAAAAQSEASKAAEVAKLAKEANLAKEAQMADKLKNLSMQNEALNTRKTTARLKMNAAAKGEGTGSTMFIDKTGQAAEELQATRFEKLKNFAKEKFSFTSKTAEVGSKQGVVAKMGQAVETGAGKVGEFGGEAFGKVKEFGMTARAGLKTAGEFVGGGLAKVGEFTGVGPSVSKAIQAIESAAGTVLKPITKAVSYVGEAFSPLIKVLQPIGKIVGRLALPLQIALTAFDFVGDAMQGYKEGGITGAIQGFFLGPMKTDMETTLGQVGKYFGLGMMFGMPGGPIGMLTGGLLGAAVGATIQAVKSAFESYKTDGLSGFISQLFMGDKEGGLLSAIKTAGPYALAGAVAGSIFPVVGTLVGGIAGAALGGLVGWFGQFAIGNFVQDLTNAMSEWGPNPAIISMFDQSGMKYAPMFAKSASIVPIIGPLAGGVIGAALDGIIGVFNFASWSLDKITEFSTWANDGIISMFSGMQYGSQFAQYGAFTVPIVGPIIGGILGSVVDAGVLLFSGISGIVSWLSGAKTWIDDSLSNLWPGENAKAGAKMFSGLIPVPGVGPIVGGILGAVVDALMYFAGPIMNIGANITKYLKDKMGAAYDFIFGGDSSQAKKDMIAKNDAERAARDIKQGKGTPVLTLEQAKAAAGKSTTALAGGKVPVGTEQQEYDKYLEKWNAATSNDDKKKLTAEYNAAKETRKTPTTQTTQVAGGSPVTPKAITSPTVQPSYVEPQSVGAGNQPISQILQNASAATGAPLDIMTKTAYAESTFNPNAKASTSSASGLFQFIKKTWDSITGRKGSKYGITPQTSPFDPNANALMGGEFINENIKDIQGKTLTSPPTAADVYAAHFLGSGGAKQLFREIKKDPNTTANKVFPEQAASNLEMFYKNKDKSKPKTVKELYEVFAAKMRVDPGPALAKAGTGLTMGEQAGSAAYKTGQAIRGGIGGLAGAIGGEGAKEKALGVMDAIGGAFGKIKDAFSEAFNRQFNDAGLMKNGVPTPPKKKPDIITASATPGMLSNEAEREKFNKDTKTPKYKDTATSMSFDPIAAAGGPQAVAALNAAEKKQNVVTTVGPSAPIMSQTKEGKKAEVTAKIEKLAKDKGWNETQKNMKLDEALRRIDKSPDTTAPGKNPATEVKGEMKSAQAASGASIINAVSPSVSSIPDVEKEKQIKDLLSKGQPIMDPALRKYAKEKGLLTYVPETIGDKIGSLWNSAQKFGTNVVSAGKEALMGQDLNPVAAKSDVEIMKVDQKQGDIAQVAAASKEDSTSIFDTKTIKAKADAMLKSVQEKGASLFGKGAVKGMTGSMPPTPQIQVQRGSFGTEITSSFSILEKDIFGSLDGALINSTANYPFASKMQHV